MRKKLNKFLLCFFLLGTIVTYGQSSVTGTITDDSGPLPGVTVVVKGTSKSAVSNFDGEYSLEGLNSGDVISYRYLGYVTKEVTYTNQTTIDVVLKEDSQSLDEVVVVGYGSSTKGKSTTSIATISSEEFNSGAISNPEELFQGKAAGVNVIQSSGEPGSGVLVRIRGGKSITASNDPLYIIDGLPIDNTSAIGGASGIEGLNDNSGNPLAFLNPNDIESINILKDAAAAAIYGSRGSNGVVLITTKKGKKGGMRSSYQYLSSFGKVRNPYDIYSASEIRSLKVDGLTVTDGKGNTDWQDEIYRLAISQSHNLSFSGGTDNSTYRVSIGYVKNEGVIKGSDLERLSGRVNITKSALNDLLKFSGNVTLSNVNRRYTANEQLGGFQGGVLNGIFNYSPLLDIYNDKEGSGFTQSGTFFNPVQTLDNVDDRGIENRILGSINTTINFSENLKGNINLGFDRNEGQRNIFIKKESNIITEGGHAGRSFEVKSNKLIEAYLSYNKNFDKHSIEAVGGYSYQNFISEGFGASARNLLLNSFSFNSFSSNAESPREPSAFKNESELVSLFGRVAYDYDNKYIASVSFRRDGSSRFGKDNKYALFPGVSAAWNIINEDFMENNSLFDQLKLKASWGKIGNQAIEPYQSLATLSSSGSIKSGDVITQSFFFDNYANPKLKWETTSTINFGVDWSILEGKISGGFEYYKSTTDDLLLTFDLPSPADPNSILANAGSVENSGFEGNINFSIINKKDFTFDLSMNFATLNSKVLEISNDTYQTNFINYARVSGEGASDDNVFRIAKGQPLHSFFGRKFAGLVDGLETYEDINGDGKIDAEDRTFLGDAQPDLTYALTAKIRYKRFDASLFFRGVSGVQIYNNTTQTYGLPSRLGSRNVVKGALGEGESIKSTRQFSDRFIENGSFFRLDNVVLGYNLDIDNKYISNARITLTGQNIFVITPYSGQDPEVTAVASDNGINIQGIDYLTYPRPTTISIGLSFNF